jgi:hypothetical protein
MLDPSHDDEQRTSMTMMTTALCQLQQLHHQQQTMPLLCPVVVAKRMLAGCRSMSPGKGHCLEPQLIPVMTATGVKWMFKQWHRQTPRGAKKKKRKLPGLSEMKL